MFVPERNYDGRNIVHSTPRYRGTSTCFTSIDDDQTDETKVWGGSNKLKLDHMIGQSSTQTIYMDFNTVVNKTYLLSGHLHWDNCVFNELTVQVVTRPTVYSASSNTNYDIVNGLIVDNPGGTGTVDVLDADRKLVAVPINEYGNKVMSGFWDADYNTGTLQFENITPNNSGDGNYNMFASEIVFHSYLNNYIMNINDSVELTSFDADLLAHNTRLKFIFETIGVDHNWQFSGAITMFRTKSA